MKNQIAKKIKETKPKPIYVQASEKFGVSYSYVVKIAIGSRNATRGKGLELKKWLLEQIVINKKAQKN